MNQQSSQYSFAEIKNLLTETSLDRPAELPMFRSDHSNSYLSSLCMMLQFEKDYTDNDPDASIYCQSVATSLACIGELSAAYEIWNQHATPDTKQLEHADIEKLKQVKLFDAKAAILEVAKSKQVIMINEAHHEPQHRRFSRQLLEGLYNIGFRYFASETLNHFATGQLNDGRALTYYGGTYIDEPQYANLIKHAVDVGFKLVAYEDKNGNAYSLRDSMQAKNLMNILDENPNAKILVHAGYGHIYKVPSQNWVKMADYFAQMSNIDPFCIDQVYLTSKGDSTYENAYYRNIIEGFSPSRPSILKYQNDFWRTPTHMAKVDMQVIHPPTTNEYGRPYWLYADDNLKWHKIPYQKEDGIVLAQAFTASELETEDINDVIPVDQYLVKTDQKNNYLLLPAGKYLLRFINAQEEVLREMDVVVS